MIFKKHIENDLLRLDNLYLGSVTGTDPRLPIFYSKLGVLELTGWVEESFDSIARRAVKGRLKVPKFQSLAENVIKKTYGFDYDNHFLLMMSKIVGVGKCEELDSLLNSTGMCTLLKSELNAVMQQRGNAAHVNLASTSIRFDSPSISLGRMRKLYPVLRTMYQWSCR